MAATDSTAALYDAVRLRLLTFAPADGSAPLSGRLSGGLAITAPASAPFPYGVLRFQNFTDTLSGIRLEGELETSLFCQPRSELPALEEAADVVCQALKGYADAAGGVMKVTLTDRDTLPRYPKPAEAEIGAIRLLHKFVLYPLYLTQYE